MIVPSVRQWVLFLQSLSFLSYRVLGALLLVYLTCTACLSYSPSYGSTVTSVFIVSSEPFTCSLLLCHVFLTQSLTLPMLPSLFLGRLTAPYPPTFLSPDGESVFAARIKPVLWFFFPGIVSIAASFDCPSGLTLLTCFLPYKP